MTRAEWLRICTEARALAMRGQMIFAIKLLREKTDCGLIEARNAVLKLMNARVKPKFKPWEDIS